MNKLLSRVGDLLLQISEKGVNTRFPKTKILARLYYDGTGIIIIIL